MVTQIIYIRELNNYTILEIEKYVQCRIIFSTLSIEEHKELSLKLKSMISDYRFEIGEGYSCFCERC